MNWISFFICIFLTFSQITCSGLFEFRLKSFRNDNGLNSFGRCCSQKTLPNGSCQGSCKTRFRICLKQYQAEIDTTSSCTFGAAATKILGDNTFNLTATRNQPQEGTSINPISFPFDFTWPGPFTLIVEAYHDTDDSISTTATTESLISRFSMQGETGVSSNWTQYSSRSSASKEIQFEYRVICADNYYGAGCQTLCRKRDDDFGHYDCSASGEIICLDGWQGKYCVDPLCSGCNLKNGHCHKPNECICKSGYRGPTCDECELYPGCVHGTCDAKWKCNCKEGWGGLFCNQDLNFCTNHKPCLNSGTCTNTGQGSYTCKCPPGFLGTDCEIKVKDCTVNPCLNNGTCVDDTSVFNDGYTCQCRYGWNGKHCETQVETCASRPCLNGATCSDSSQGYKCECSVGFGGRKCELQVQNCNPNPCMNGGKCSALKGNQYKCHCAKGFEGTKCEENIDDCHGNPCKNGGRCLDGINQYQCKCTPGYTGALCDKRVDFCLVKPCANGGSCINIVNGFECACRSGFTGIDCGIDIDECQSAPCKNGATCFNRVNSYECQCPDGFQGVNCDETVNQASTSSYQEAQIRSRNDNLSSSQIALIAILSVAVPFIAICGIAVAICMKRKRKREQEKDDAEARKQNEQNASHITHLHQHHHNAIVSVKRSSNSTMALDNNSATHHMIKNTWDKSINNMTNSISMDDGCMLNTSMYGTMSNFSDNTSGSGANTSQVLLGADAYQSQKVPESLQRAKSQKQLNTDPAVVNRASLIMHRHQPTTKELALDKRISVLAEAASWSGNNHANTSRILDRCSPPHI